MRSYRILESATARSFGFLYGFYLYVSDDERDAHWDWCQENFGVRGASLAAYAEQFEDDTPFIIGAHGRWNSMGPYVLFMEADDAFAFKMRWL